MKRHLCDHINAVKKSKMNSQDTSYVKSLSNVPDTFVLHCIAIVILDISQTCSEPAAMQWKVARCFFLFHSPTRGVNTYLQAGRDQTLRKSDHFSQKENMKHSSFCRHFHGSNCNATVHRVTFKKWKGWQQFPHDHSRRQSEITLRCSNDC